LTVAHCMTELSMRPQVLRRSSFSRLFMGRHRPMAFTVSAMMMKFVDCNDRKEGPLQGFSFD